MITQEQWQQAKEEFGSEAYKRFYNGCGILIEPLNNNDCIKHIDDMLFKPLPELFEHDVQVYGENAYLMWEYKNVHFDEWQPAESNLGLWLTLNCEHRRKTSAALPFDLERAKAGDVVEIYDNNYWKKCQSKIFENRKYPLIQLDNISVSERFLRMKYPPKQEKQND